MAAPQGGLTAQQALAMSLAAQQSIAAIQQLAAAAAVAMWDSFAVHDDAALADFQAQWLPVLQGTQHAVGLIAQTSIVNTVETLTNETLPPVTIPVEDFTGAAIRNGTPPSEVYSRPFIQFWSALSQQKPIQPALQSAQARLQTTASTDVRLAYTHAAKATISRMPEGAHVVGYRRVLGSDNPCPLCVISASQRYRSADLMPIHNNCHCSVEPIIGTKSLGQRVEVVSRAGTGEDNTVTKSPDQGYTVTTKRKDGSTYSYTADLTIHNHGELGPYLSYAGDNWLGQAEAMARAA